MISIHDGVRDLTQAHNFSVPVIALELFDQLVPPSPSAQHCINVLRLHPTAQCRDDICWEFRVHLGALLVPHCTRQTLGPKFGAEYSLHLGT
jgi:hypothetical protein